MIFRHLLNMRSHPTWVRGLKLYLSLTRQKISVAPYVGAWIETRRGHTWRWQHASHPTWVRGLKPGSNID